MKEASKRLVIDASVARAAGAESATHPTAVHCREFLKEVRSLGYRVVLTESLRDEWERHQSRFARTWKFSMERQRRVEAVVFPDAEDITLPDEEDLQRRVISTASNPREVDAIEKDFHLLQAALATDQTIASLDERVRELFRRAAEQVGEIRGVVWVNPANESEEPIAWLREGAPADEHRRLSA